MKRLCDICGEPIINWAGRHEYHDEGCPNFVNYDAYPRQYPSDEPCECDFVAHPECCPQCNPLVDLEKTK